MADGTPVTYEELTDELKKKYDEVKAILEADLIGSFHRTHSHGIRTHRSLGEINYLVAHSLHRHSENLVNTLERVALRVIQEIMRHQYSPSGPALGTHQGEMPLQSRPPLPFALAAPEVPNSPAFVVYKIGGDPSDASSCMRRLRRSLTGGTSATDLEKQTWLTKYATDEPRAQLLQLAQSWKSKHGRLSTPPGESSSSTLHRHGSDRYHERPFGMVPKRRAIGYSKLYPDEYELIPLPPKYRLLISPNSVDQMVPAPSSM
ncbi:hypothetical protein QYE76_055149 [Lolium multiflorum]|uniref:Uncharacterized protein n=1 Tax=Lolium multiflorum TaxID=4521 RepID=A0AAD8T0H4_LOLMU|nr:hypothetical protein QYE76_055149 [Lolium multiflorum]